MHDKDLNAKTTRQKGVCKERAKGLLDWMGSTYRLSCSPAFIRRDLFHRTLNLDKIDVLIPELNHAFENGLDLRVQLARCLLIHPAHAGCM